MRTCTGAHHIARAITLVDLPRFFLFYTVGSALCAVQLSQRGLSLLPTQPDHSELGETGVAAAVGRSCSAQNLQGLTSAGRTLKL